MRDLKKRQDRDAAWIAVWIGAQIASALHAAHDAKNLAGETLNIVHRDVSLPNIMLSDAGHPMLFDFGVAKAKQRMRGDQPRGAQGQARLHGAGDVPRRAGGSHVDVYGLGIVLYELLAGKSPYQRPSDTETIAALQRAEVQPPSRIRREVDTSLDDVVLRAMARDRAARYATADGSSARCATGRARRGCPTRPRRFRPGWRRRSPSGGTPERRSSRGWRTPAR